MPLSNIKNLLCSVHNTEKAIGAFNVSNMEMIMGAVKAAEDKNTPIILQIAQGRLKYSPLPTIAPIMVEAAKRAKVDIAVQLDHASSIECAKQALDYGFTSVMFDGSTLSLEQNIKTTNEFTKLAQKYGAYIEAEIGKVGGSESEEKGHKCVGTKLEDAVTFLNSTNVDALAVAIGNAHGVYKSAPKLDFDLLTKLHSNLDIPLVLHGGSGISAQDYMQCAKLGMSKINIATANFMAVVSGAGEYLQSQKQHNYFDLSDSMVQGIYNNVVKHINIFNKEI